jgi:DNA polymerase-1
MGDLSFEDKKVGILFGYLKQVLSIANKFDTNKFIFAWDSKESKRKELFPEYKANRHYDKTPEEEELDAIAYSQFDTIRKEVIPTIGFKNNFMVKGYEADDIIASITKRYNAEEFLIVSSDNDLLQLLSDHVKIYNIKTKTSYNEAQMIKDYNISHVLWPKVKAIAGCNSDAIPGVRGVGEKTAIKYLNDQLKPESSSYQEIENFIKYGDYKRNIQLVTLPYRKLDFMIYKQKETSYKGMYSICEKYGFQSLLKKETLQQWVKNLKAI